MNENISSKVFYLANNRDYQIKIVMMKMEN